jgi:DNA-binding transcriptional LysR family regulator
MQFETLKVFCDLADTESFTKAAQMNQVTQSAVSQQISALERTFKSLLIERSKKNFRLTREGHVLYDYARQILHTFDLLNAKMQDVQEIVAGAVRVASIYSIGLHELPPYVMKFLQRFPQVNLHVEYRRADQVYEDVLGNLVDIGLVSFPEKDARLDIVPLWKDRLVLVCHPQNALAKGKSIKLAALNNQKFIAFEPDMSTRKAVDKILRDHDVSVRNVMEFDNIETAKRAVEIDSGVAILPEATVTQEVAKKTLAALQFQDGEFLRPSAAIYRKGKVLSPAMKEFLALLKS